MVSTLFAAALSLAAASPEVFALDAQLDVWDVAVVDINGDGSNDILALCCDEESYPLKKHVAVFLAGKNGTYTEKPSLLLPLPPGNGGAFLSETDGVAPKELVTVESDRATVYGWAADGLKVKSEVALKCLFPHASKTPRFMERMAVDLDGDGTDEWLVPQPDGFSVRTAEKELTTVSCDVTSTTRTNSAMSITFHFPAMYPFTLEGQPQKALAFLTDTHADFAHGDGWKEHTRFKVPLNLGEKWEAMAQMEDINVDGNPDLVVTQTQGTVNMQALTQIYLAGAPMQYPDEPTASFLTKGAYASPFIEDVNGDENPDIVFLNVPVGVKFFINYFVRRKVTVGLHVHLFKDGGFAQEPDYKTTVTIDAPEGREQTAYCIGDFNGDGFLDAAFGSGADKMVVHVGSNEKFLSAQEWTTLAVPAFGEADIYDLNGNEADDIILIHPGIDNKQRIEVVVF